MKSRTAMLLLSITAISTAPQLSPAADEDEFHGRIESRPNGQSGIWVIEGRQVAVTEQTRLEEDDGPLMVGACAEVEYEGGRVEEIESEEPRECGQASAGGSRGLED